MIPSMEYLIPRALDVTEPESIQVEYDGERKVLYININGITLFRACKVGEIRFDLDGYKAGRKLTPKVMQHS